LIRSRTSEGREHAKHGFEGSRLSYLLNGAGFFHQAHRAVDYCHALLEILAFELPTTGTSALTHDERWVFTRNDWG
jgi:hypothetical protein